MDIVDGDVKWSVLFLRDRLVKNLSFPEAEVNAKQPRGVRKSKMWCAAKLALCGRRGHSRPQREGPWSASPGSWCWLGGAVDWNDYHPYDSRSQDTTLRHAFRKGKGLPQVSIEFDLAAMVVVQLDHHLWKIGVTAKSLLDRPLSCLAHWVKSCCEVDKSSMVSLVLFLAFFMQLTEDEHYICRACVGSKATLGIFHAVDGGWALCMSCLCWLCSHTWHFSCSWRRMSTMYVVPVLAL